MRIALVYDLRDDYRALGFSEEAVAEFDSVETIDALAGAIETLGCEPIRVGRGPRGVAVGETSVWVANASDGTVTRIDPAAGEVVGDPIPVGRDPRELTIGEGSVWVANARDSTVTRIDPADGEVVGDPIDVGEDPIGITVGAGSVWTANFRADTVTQIRP